MRSAPRGLEGEGEMSGTQSGGLADPEGRIACPACTFLNHRYLAACEICSTPLPSSSTTKNITTVPTGNGTGHLGISGEEGKVEIVRLSFRKGGEKEAYKRLKNVLSDKVWERVCLFSSHFEVLYVVAYEVSRMGGAIVIQRQMDLPPLLSEESER